jgi:hypothetical protein
MRPSAHSVLRHVDGGELIIAADFGIAGRPSATFMELVEGMRSKHTIWETMPPPLGLEDGMTGPEHVSRWVRDIRSSSLPVRAVIGFCSGSVYASALVSQVSRWQERPRLILIDPALAERYMVIDHYERFMRARLAPVLSGDEIDDAVRAGRNADAQALGPLELASRLGQSCREILPPACQRAGMTDERSTELAGIFASYLNWLAAASQLEPRTGWLSATVLNSQSRGFGLDTFPEEERGCLAARVIDLNVSHLELMREPEAAQVIDQLLV